MEIRIAGNWEKRPPSGGTAVVIDVIRFSTTLCALLRAGRKVSVAGTPSDLGAAKNLPAADVYSELEVDTPSRRFDNSPSQAIRSSSSRPAYVTTTWGSRALLACRDTDRALIGCFANFDAIVKRLRRCRGRIWLIPAGKRKADVQEDFLCAEAFAQAIGGKESAAERALMQLRNSGRVADFLKFRPRWGDQDLIYCLGLNKIPLVPRAVFGKNGKAGLARIVK